MPGVTQEATETNFQQRNSNDSYGRFPEALVNQLQGDNSHRNMITSASKSRLD